jgi:DivIVA domain-containing protein
MTGMGALLLVVVLAAVVAGIVLAATGRVALLSDAPPDSPARGLPPGPLRAADLDAVRLPMAVRGYRMAEVEEVLDRLRDELARREGDGPVEPELPDGEPVEEAPHGDDSSVPLDPDQTARAPVR